MALPSTSTTTSASASSSSHQRCRWMLTRMNHVLLAPLLLLLMSCSLEVTAAAAAASGESASAGGGGGDGRTTTNSNYFNFEIEKRILERLDYYLGGPMGVNEIVYNFRYNDGFPNNLLAADRDLYLKLAYSVSQPLVYFGLEDGTCIGYYWSNGYYREPGNSGYSTIIRDNISSGMEKHYNSCINNDTGEPTTCDLPVGAQYIQCKDDLGDDVSGQCDIIEPCEGSDGYEGGDNEDDIKWCRQYTIETAEEALETMIVEDILDGDGTNNESIPIITTPTKTNPGTPTSGRGFIPLTNMCMNSKGQFSQVLNTIIDPLGETRTASSAEDLITCTYANGDVVNRQLSGDYAACGNVPGSTSVSSTTANDIDDSSNSTTSTTTTTSSNIICDTVFAGGYQSWEYDPRYRPWYIETKRLQKSIWLKPFPFFTLGIGVTYATPIYSTTTDDQGKQMKIFEGVLAVDYRFEDITRFLIESYGNTSTAVVIYEDEEPNYLIGASTGYLSARNMLTEDLSQPCPVDRGDGVPCTPIRISVLDMGKEEELQEEEKSDDTDDSSATATSVINRMDRVLSKAAIRHMEAGYPQNLLSLKDSDDDLQSQVYVSQSTLYTQPGAELVWRVIVVAPGTTSTTDNILYKENPGMFVGICIVAALGMVACSAFLYIMYQKRAEKAIVYADWRFTCAFIVGSILLNGSSFSLLGQNTDSTCLLRMWMFHLCFALALAPLFVKVWRIHKLVGSSNIRRNTISNMKAALFTMPMLLVQFILLLVFTFVDPPQQMELIEEDGGLVVQRIVCASGSDARFYTLGAYEASLVIVGCVLAYLTRNLQDDFGEAKQMTFSMYNIAFVGIMVACIVQAAGLDGNGESIMQAVGVFWGTVFSTGAFVIPRLLQVRETRRQLRAGRSTNIHISGILQPPATGLGSIQESEMEYVDRPSFGAPRSDNTSYAAAQNTQQPTLTMASLGSSSNCNTSGTQSDASQSNRENAPSSTRVARVDLTGEVK